MRTIDGSINDIFFAVLIMLVASISLVLAFYLSAQIQPQLVSTLGGTIVNPIFLSVNQALSVMADGVVLVYIATNLVAIVAAYFVKSHPVLAIAAFIIMLVQVVLANIATNVFQSIIQTSFFIGIGNTNIPFIVLLFKIVPLAVFVFGAILIFVQYSKSPSINASV